jgi:hypothetical protein
MLGSVRNFDHAELPPTGNNFATTCRAGFRTGLDTLRGVTPAAWHFTNNADIAGFAVDCNAYQGNNIAVLLDAAPTPAPGSNTTAVNQKAT